MMIKDVIVALIISIYGVQGMSSVLFGSCNRQNKPQVHWEQMSRVIDREMELFLWTGDSVYVKNHTLDALKGAYGDLLGNEHYETFVESTKLRTVDGIWDDHDLGVNDAGILPDRVDRATLFTNFLGLSGSGASPEEDWTRQVEENEGLYHVRDVDTRDAEGGALMKIIFLDTRYARQPHYIRSLGEINLPLTALVAAALRVAYTFMGLGGRYLASVLGEKQWAWLDETLKRSEADYHVIVSSIQVLTTNPAVESWGHFPTEKSRLLTLLATHNPRGAVLLSGDVHHGEVSSVGFFEEMPPTSPMHGGQEGGEEVQNVCAGDQAACVAERELSIPETPVAAKANENEGANVKSVTSQERDYGRYGVLADLVKQVDERREMREERRKAREEARGRGAVERVERGRLYEVTSSGLTHTCGDGLVTGLLCPLMLNTYTRHRQRGQNTNDRDGYFIGRNFGQLRFDNVSLEVSVRALPSGAKVLYKTVLPQRVPTSREGVTLQIRARDFFRLYRDASLAVRIVIYALLQYAAYKGLKWLISAVRMRFSPHGGRGGGGEGEQQGKDSVGIIKNGPAQRSRAMQESSHREELSDGDESAGGTDGDIKYWSRRLYTGKDAPNDISVDLETTDGENGARMHRKARVNDSYKRTVNIEYVFQAGDRAQAGTETRQPKGQAEGEGQKALRDVEVEKLRLFFGVSLSPEARQTVEEGTMAVKALPVKDGDVALKWSPSSNYHVTVKFVGEIDKADVQTLITRMDKELSLSKHCSPFRMALQGAGCFPSDGHPRILWVGVDGHSTPSLTALRLAAEKALLSDDSAGEALVPHCTVARCNANKKDASIPNAAAMKFLEDCRYLQSEPFLVDSVELYLSSSGNDDGGVKEFAGRSGSVYSVLHSFKL